MTADLDFLGHSKRWGIAITGGIASGKSTVAGILRSLGHTVIDADQVSRLVVAAGTPGLREVEAHFGKEILTPAGEMDRAKMREIVFNNAAERAKLEGIIHHRLSEASAELLEKDGIFSRPRYWFYEASLIFERGREKDFAQVWVVYALRETQITRVMARDKIDRAAALKILAAQMSPNLKRDRADLVIDSDCSREELQLRVKVALNRLPSGAGV